MEHDVARAARRAWLALGALAVPLAAQTQFAEPGRPMIPQARLDAIAAGDVDGDGDLDLMGSSPYTVALYLNDGNGTFTDVSATHVPVVSGRNGLTAVALLRDLDGDGDVDLFLGNFGGHLQGAPDELYLNDGTGRFAEASSRLPPAFLVNTRGAAIRDFDGDGDLDIAGATTHLAAGTQDLLYLNDGTATFTAVPMPPRIDNSNDVAAADVDADGDVDLAFANAHLRGIAEQNALYLNDGSARFVDVTSTHLPAQTNLSWGVAAVDVDGDGDDDLAWAGSAQEELYLNDGTGRFVIATAALLPASSGGTGRVTAADIDEDGDFDLLFGGAASKLYLNDGTGRFSDASVARLPTVLGGLTGLADLDGDLDLDALLPGDPPALWVNRVRHVSATGPAVLGQPYTLRFHAEAGYASAPQIVFPFVGVTPAVPPIPVPPFGSFGLGTAGLAVLPPQLAPIPSGEIALTFALPAAPVLAGQPLLAQSLVLHFAPLRAHFSNVHRDTLQ